MGQGTVTDMKRHTAVAAVVLTAALALAGCGRGDSSTTSETLPKRTTTTTAKSKSIRDLYLDGMRERFPYQSDAQLIELGHTACDAIDSYGSIEDTMIAIALDPRWSVEEAGDAGYTFAFAVPAFCPEYLAELESLAA